MTKFILILIFTNGLSMNVEFDSEKACKAAGSKIMQSMREARPNVYLVTAECHAK